MVKRVVIALQEVACYERGILAGTDLLPFARAAIAAMREPTKEQLSAAIMSFPPWGGHGESSAPSEDDMWRAMIDAALKEPAS
jgi:hypothetical protein